MSPRLEKKCNVRVMRLFITYQYIILYIYIFFIGLDERFMKKSNLPQAVYYIRQFCKRKEIL